ncbi:hypothetical protein M231_04098 [Tremella mesenterica]|uniref:Uncharacterized protein n=1 Tax=Tremella mesenterica TaxID=5217 RepID=A0A4Q1BLR2_TREME|nr:hypothetical protein M231_04098 [Tremella mesenterica]
MVAAHEVTYELIESWTEEKIVLKDGTEILAEEFSSVKFTREEFLDWQAQQGQAEEAQE